MGKSVGRAVFLLSLLFSQAYSEENFVEILHREISYLVYSTVEKIDRFFADQRAKEESRAYLRFRAGFRYTGEPDYQTILNTDLKFRLRKLEKRLLRVVVKEDRRRDGGRGKRKITLLKHRVSVGISGIPKVYGKYEIFTLPVIYKRWEITLFQRFKATYRFSDYKLEERTQLYIDRLIAPETVWRILFERYNASDLHFQRLNYYTYLRRYGIFKKGRTAVDFGGGIRQDRIINGRVGGYTVRHRFRANFWKRWAFFNLQVGTDWNRDRGFKATPFVMVYFEFYAGKF
ncbi:MAG: hypothetical protein GXN94_05855 [Aquificae bacterium]|nr:hypothetical protein [Aquificota bacterium]